MSTKTVKVTISMPENRLINLKKKAKASGMSLSSFISNSASDVIRYDMQPIKFSDNSNSKLK